MPFDERGLMCLLCPPQPFLLPSESRLEYDSEESLGSEDEEDEDEYSDAFDSSSPLREHSNHNSYRCPRTSVCYTPAGLFSHCPVWVV